MEKRPRPWNLEEEPWNPFDPAYPSTPTNKRNRCETAMQQPQSLYTTGYIDSSNSSIVFVNDPEDTNPNDSYPLNFNQDLPEEFQLQHEEVENPFCMGDTNHSHEPTRGLFIETSPLSQEFPEHDIWASMELPSTEPRVVSIEYVSELASQLGYKLVPLDKSGNECPVENSAKRKGKKKASSVEQWWAARKLKRTQLLLSPDDMQLMKLPAEDFLKAYLSLSSSADISATPTVSGKAATRQWVQTMEFTTTLDTISTRTTVLQIVMRIFFFIASHPTPTTWSHTSQRYADQGSRLVRLTYIDYERLYGSLSSFLPHSETTGAPLSLTEFRTRMIEWRKQGSWYAWFAWRMGLGSLVHMRAHIRPEQLWGSSKGGEASRISDHVLCWLEGEEVGLRELSVESGAEDLMHRLLWGVCSRFPGFPVRQGDEAFPGFEN